MPARVRYFTDPACSWSWAAEPLVEVPFTTNTKWVRWGDKEWKLHGRNFGNAAGPVAVSPDLTQAVLHNLQR